MADTQQVETTVQQSGVLKFGMQGLKNPTPTWATWTFRVEFLLNKALLIWLSQTKLIPLTSLPEIILALTLIDGMFWGVGRFLGIKKEDIESV